MQKGILTKLSSLIALCLLLAISANAQTMPEIGRSYYIAAQTWDGSKYVERFLYLSNNYVYQTTDIAQASRWSAEKPGNGNGIAIRCNGKSLMRGGISSASWGCIIAEPTIEISEPPVGSLTIKSTVTNVQYYVIAPNAGTVFTAVNAANEASYQPKTSLYTPYFKFYDAADTKLMAVTEKLEDGTPMAIGASYVFTDGKTPVGGNLWPLASGTIAIENDSYDHVFYTFKGFKVGNSSELVQSVSTNGLSDNTTITAVFATNDLTGQNFTFISACPSWYTNQQAYKAIYLDTTDNKLKWKTYDPADDAFYFKAHGSFDNLTFESVALPGNYITGATSAVSPEGATITISPLGAGDYSIVANSQNFYAYGHNNGRNLSGTISDAAGTSGSEAAWWIQNANDKNAEVTRYQSALDNEADKVVENERQIARNSLRDAIRSVVVGENMGNVPLDAYDLAVATYENNTLAKEDYTNAITILYNSCRVPAVGTRWRIINTKNTNQLIAVGANDGLVSKPRQSSLYQIWIVEAVHSEDAKRLAFRNLGSGTYMSCNTMSANTPTVTTDQCTYLNLNATSPAVFTIEVTDRADQYIYLSTSNANAIIVNSPGTTTTWKFEEVNPTELGQLSVDEDDRRAKREELLDLIGDVKTLCSPNRGIGYYSTLATAVTTAQGIYDDGSRLTQDYQNGINNLQTAVRNAQYNKPRSEAMYIICDHDGRIAMQHVDNAATMVTYNDTNNEHFWKMALVESANTEENLLPWTQRYTLTSVEGENTVLNITAQLIGNDEYYITIDGDNAWNQAYGQTPMSIHQATVGTDHNYLTNGDIYRIRNVATGKVLTRSELWVSRVSVETADSKLQDWNQLWKVEKQVGADRYQFHNVETNRHIEEQMSVGSQLAAAFTPGTWHLEPTGTDGQYQILTTMAPIDQLAIGYNADKAVAVAQGSAGTTWVFEKVTPVEKPNPNRQVYKLINRNYTTNTVNDYLYTDDRYVGHSRGKNADYYTREDHPNQKWTLSERDSVRSDGTKVLDGNGNVIRLVEIQSGYCSKYIAPQNNTARPITVKSTPYAFQLIEYTDASTGQTYLMFKNPTSNQYVGVDTSNPSLDKLVWKTSLTDKAAHWSKQELEGEILNDEAVLDRNDSMWGYTKPSDNAVVRIVTSIEKTVSATSAEKEYTCLDENYKQNILQHSVINEKRYAQLWRLHQNPQTGLYKFENVYTGNYIVNTAAANNTLTTTADESKAGEFAIAHNKNVTATRQYNILDANLGYGMSAANTNIAANGVPTDREEITTSEFRFMLPMNKFNQQYTEEDFAKMRKKYEENRDMMKYVSKYDEILQQLFVDRSYTTLRDDLSTEALEEALDNLPEILVDMVNKIHNDQWPTYASGTNWDKMFRIRQYPVVSHSNFSQVLNCTFHFSQLNEPFGIIAHPGDVLAIMVKDEPKPGCTLSLQTAQGFARYASGSYPLKQGLNLVQITDECYLFLNYMINSTADNPNNYLSNFPDIEVHIEGGEVNGCINRVHGPGDGTAQNANTVWQKMIADGLIKNGAMTQVVSETLMMNFNSWDFIQSCPVHIGDVIDLWDSWVKVQQWVMGLRDREGNIIGDYVPNLDKRWNSKWGAYERSGGYMDANGGGTEYESSTIRGIINYESLRNGGGQWGPVHEIGHEHQPAINMCGMTEVSNNLFSNVNTREFGAIVSRGSSLPDAANVFARGGNWFDNNIWVQTQMYFKLYMYYHVAGNDPNFYPKLFKRLRNDGFLRNPNVAIPADRDYLKFAKACSEVAGEDLSEFFEAYGMLRPLTPEHSLNGEASFAEWKGVKCRTVGDYSTYHVYTTDEMIEEAKNFMHSCGPKNGSILFIDDRIRQEAAAHPAAKQGQMRAGRGDGGKIGAYGNVGMWNEFTQERHSTYAKNYTMTKEWSAKGVTLHISGTGAVGYKIYGPEGELVYFSAFNDILIPSVILNKYDLADLVVVAAQADGTSVEITCEEDAKYAITTYRDGNSEGVTTSSTGRFKPELKNNDVCVVESIADLTLDEFTYGDEDNVILKDSNIYTMEQLNLKDLTNFYIPDDVYAKSVAHQRVSSTAWNSVCLPFAVSESDFGTPVKIYTISSIEEEDGSKTICIYRRSSVEAGEPCYVLCEEEGCTWDFNIANTTVAANVTPTPSLDGNLIVNGSFIKKTIGEGKYKLNSAGTSFGITTEKGIVYPFRSYLETKDSTPKSFRVRVIDRTTSVEDIIEDRALENGKIYDLMGREMPKAIKGQPYILNGKVHYDK